MEEVATAREVHAEQLSYELGGVGLRVVFNPDVRVVKSDEVAEPELEAGVDAHVAEPGWEHPDPPPQPPTRSERIAAAQTLDELKLALLEEG